MDNKDLKRLKDFYSVHLFDNLVSFWMKNGIDKEHGGYFTCFNNRGDRLMSKNKYIWSQGRFLWMLSRLYYQFKDYLAPERLKECVQAMDSGADFLKNNAVLPNGRCVWVLDEAGQPLMVDRQGRIAEKRTCDTYDKSVLADLFLVYGMAEYSDQAFFPME